MTMWKNMFDWSNHDCGMTNTNSEQGMVEYIKKVLCDIAGTIKQLWISSRSHWHVDKSHKVKWQKQASM